MKIFISGATGFIGSHLVKLLLQQNHTLHLLVRTKKNENVLNHANVVYFLGDITDKNSLDAAIKDCDQAYHLAVYAEVWSKTPALYSQINVNGTLNVLNAALENQVKKVVVVSSAAVYGPSVTSIITEDKVRETIFFNDYEVTKNAAEELIRSFVKRHSLPVVIATPTRVFGPLLQGKAQSINLMINQYIHHSWRVYPGSGKEIGNYVYVDDVVNGLVLVMQKGKSGQSYLLGGDNLTYIQFYHKLSEATGIKRKMWRVPLLFQYAIAYYFLMKAKLFGFKPLITPKWISKGTYHWEVSSAKAEKELGYVRSNIDNSIHTTCQSFQLQQS